MKRKRAKYSTLFLIGGCLIIICALIPVKGWGFLDFTKPIGYDADAMARGGTSIAIGEDPSNMNVNPAGISEIKGNALEFNLLTVFPDFDYKYWGRGGKRYTSSDKDRFLLAPGLSFAHHGKGSRWSWGLTLAAPDAVATDYTIQSKFFGPVSGYSENLHLRFGPAIAYQITPTLSVGVRLGLDYHTLDMRAPLGLTYMDIGQCDGFGFSAAIGLLYKPTKNLSFGFYYESPAFMQDLETQHNGDGYLKMMTPMGEKDLSGLDVKVKDMDFPQNLGFGVAYRPIPSLRLSADVKYVNWDKDWDEMEIEFSGGDLGSHAMNVKVPLNIDDQVTFGIGMEYFFGGKYKISLGYHYNDDAMSDNYLFPYVPAQAEHTITCGFAMEPTKNVKISLAYMLAIMDDPSSSSHHAYDQALEKQLGMPPGALQSELNDAKCDYTAQGIQLSISYKW